jgi:dienelactone hydrolase
MITGARNLLILVVALIVGGIALAEGPPRGAFSMSASLPELIGEEAAARFESVVAPDEAIEWELYVPASYNPEIPPGLLVYISPSDSGELPEGWQAVLDEANLVWIGANDSGNRVQVARRATYAMVAPALAARDYPIDSSRVYVSGFSGGGRVASMIAPDYPHVFRGAIYICGVNPWDKRESERADTVRANRYVFLTGRKDFNRRETRSVHRAYKRAGVENALLMDIPGMDHSLPSPAKLAEALRFLDQQSLDRR